MVWAASTVIAVGAVGAAAVGGIAAANASSKAASAQLQASSDANATQLAQYNQTRADQAPWRSSGEAALNQLNIGLGLNNAYAAPDKSENNFDAVAYLKAHPEVNDNNLWSGSAYSHFLNGYGDFIGTNSYNQQLAASQSPQTTQGQAGFGDLNRKFTADDFTADPGYDFRLSEGMKGINNSAAARGGVLSGAALKAASKYNQNFASNEYSNVYNRFNTDQTNKFNRLASIAGVGQMANNQVAAAGTNMANNVSQNQLGAGNARASGYVGQSNALTGGISQAYNMYQGNQLMNRLGGSGTAGTSGTTGGTSWSPYGTGVSDQIGYDGYDFRE